MQNLNANILIFKDQESASKEVVYRFICTAWKSIEEHGEFYAAIPGGSSPRRIFEILVGQNLPWDHIHIFFTDERYVLPESDDSNYKLANDLFLSKVPIPEKNIHRFLTELSPGEAAVDYESQIKAVMGDNPEFDLIILGMGEDTHIASLFPGSPALNEKKRLAVVNEIEKLSAQRLTLTIPALNKSRNIIILAFGDSKAESLNEALTSISNVLIHPVHAISPENGELVWVVDQKAAARL